jgi:hypothetical protein
MICEQSHTDRLDTMRPLLNTRMYEGTLVREHCLNMFLMHNTLEVLGVEIDYESQEDLILQSLPVSFNQFRLNVSMSKKDYTLAELINKIVTREGILKNKALENRLRLLLLSQKVEKDETNQNLRPMRRASIIVSQVQCHRIPVDVYGTDKHRMLHI